MHNMQYKILENRSLNCNGLTKILLFKFSFQKLEVFWYEYVATHDTVRIALSKYLKNHENLRADQLKAT